MISWFFNKLKNKKINSDNFFEAYDEAQILYIKTMKTMYKNDIEGAYTLSLTKDEILTKNYKECEKCNNSILCAAYERLNNLILDIHRITRRTYS